MEKNLVVWQWAGFTFAVVLGTLLHFLYAWTGAYAFAPVSAVNESTWEHMKILFFPLLFFALFQSRYATAYQGFWWIKCIGIFVGVSCIPILFYTYNGAFGKSPDWLNILFFFIAAAISFFVETHLFRAQFSPRFSWLAIALLALGVVAFCVFTFIPPRLPIFQGPISGGYGL